MSKGCFWCEKEYGEGDYSFCESCKELMGAHVFLIEVTSDKVDGRNWIVSSGADGNPMYPTGRCFPVPVSVLALSGREDLKGIVLLHKEGKKFEELLLDIGLSVSEELKKNEDNSSVKVDLNEKVEIPMEDLLKVILAISKILEK